MNKNKSIFLVLGLVALILCSTLLYNVLSDKFEEKNNEEAIVAEEQTVVEDTTVAEETAQDAAEETADEEELTVMGSETEIIAEATQAPVKEEAATPNVEQKVPTSSVTATPTQGAAAPSPSTAPTAEPTVAPTKAPTYVAPTSTPVPTATPVPTKAPEPTKAPTNVNTAPNFTVQTYSGSNVSLSSNFGKPIVINFWASWCGPCKSEMPDFNSIYKEYKDKVTFMMVDMVDGNRETKADGYNYVTSQGFSFPVYYDVNQSAAYAYGINSYPTTYFIKADGSVFTYSKGAMSASTLRSQLNKLISQ